MNSMWTIVQRTPDKIGLLDKPPGSSAFLPSRASSHMHSGPALLAPQCRYEIIQVWSYTTFIVKLAVKTKELRQKLIIIMIYTEHNHYYK